MYPLYVCTVPTSLGFQVLPVGSSTAHDNQIPHLTHTALHLSIHSQSTANPQPIHGSYVLYCSCILSTVLIINTSEEYQFLTLAKIRLPIRFDAPSTGASSEAPRDRKGGASSRRLAVVVLVLRPCPVPFAVLFPLSPHVATSPPFAAHLTIPIHPSHPLSSFPYPTSYVSGLGHGHGLPHRHVCDAPAPPLAAGGRWRRRWRCRHGPHLPPPHAAAVAAAAAALRRQPLARPATGVCVTAWSARRGR